MSRKLIIFLTALSVCAYFSVILLILSPLSRVGSPFYAHKYEHKNGHPIPKVHWCKELHWRSPATQSAVALVSFPGSGNTWLRYLLQQLTGIVTGSVYMDYGLRLHGFPAENVTDGSVLVVKTHESPPLEKDQFKAAVLLIRNPRDAILADYNWLHKGHVGTAPKSAFRKKSPVHRNTADIRADGKWSPASMDGRERKIIIDALPTDKWSSYVRARLAAWRALHRAWLARFPHALHVVRYERLVRDTRHTLRGILHFLNLTATEEDMNCTLTNREGIYRRKKKYGDFDPFTRSMYKVLRAAHREILDIVVSHNRGDNETALG